MSEVSLCTISCSLLPIRTGLALENTNAYRISTIGPYVVQQEKVGQF